MKRFIKSNAIDGKLIKDIISLDVKDNAIHLPLTKMNFGVEVQLQVKV